MITNTQTSAGSRSANPVNDGKGQPPPPVPAGSANPVNDFSANPVNDEDPSEGDDNENVLGQTAGS